MKRPVLAIAVLFWAVGLIAPRISQANNQLNQQLNAAICGQNWYQAIQVIQQMKRLAPHAAGRLSAYQSRLQALADRGIYVPDWQCSAGELPSADDVPAGDVFIIPIIGRSGGIPVVQVTFNGSHTYEMLFDTGASTTFILGSMADAIQPREIARGFAVVADGRTIPTIIAEVDSLTVGDLTIDNAEVTFDVNASAEANLDGIGLLGQNVYGSYDVLIGEDTIELRQRGGS
ncbi:MAG: clan AA aspartic protease [Spirulina sp. SIO3F2]|nr:clan AA aspartic protease [Spirulina sp. SIO3F2]